MSFIPISAFGFGAESLTISPIKYGKSRVSKSNQLSYILSSKAGCMPGQPELFMTTFTSVPKAESAISSNSVIMAYKRDKYSKECNPLGSNYQKENLFDFTFANYAPHDDEALELAINASYRQVYGNFNLMESEKPIEAERHLRNGDLSIREFIRSLAKSAFYVEHYFNLVTQQRCIELSFKHILGRPPLDQLEIISQIELLSQEGFESHIDSLIDSIEYEKNFGSDIVPYQRCWNSPCGVKTSSFNNTAALTRGFASSDNAIHERITLPASTGGKSQLLISLAKGKGLEIKLPEYRECIPSGNLINDQVISKQEVGAENDEEQMAKKY